MVEPQFTCSVVARYLPEESQVEAGVYAFSYTITVRNTGPVTAQLIARHWYITDARGRVEEVHGLAVVGKQPLLRPGEQFEYTSWLRLNTPQGSMRGHYACMTEDAQPFDAPVPEFGLSVPSALH